MSAEGTSTGIYDEAIVIDALNVSNWDSSAVYKSLHSGGLTAINATIAVWENYQETMDNIEAWSRRFKKYEDILAHATSVKDILQAKKDGKVGLIFGWQNASSIENDLGHLAEFHALGVRIIQLTYSDSNLLGSGFRERSDGGLTNFGVGAIKEMNRLGILIDLSHVADRTTMEAIELSEQPVSFTHANARSFGVNLQRNKSDEALKLITERGGVIGANAHPTFLRKGFESTVQDFVDVIDDLVERVGIDHVGIGTDYTQDQPKAFYDWIFAYQGTIYRERTTPMPDPVVHPIGMETPEGLSSVAQELLNRGYKQTDIIKILGDNWLRLFQEVWGE